MEKAYKSSNEYDWENALVKEAQILEILHPDLLKPALKKLYIWALNKEIEIMFEDCVKDFADVETINIKDDNLFAVARGTRKESGDDKSGQRNRRDPGQPNGDRC